MKSYFKLIFTILFMSTGLYSGYGQIQVMTYNIKYANENDGENSWSQRKDHLRDLLRFYEPEIFGVQEALAKQLEYLKKGFENYDFTGLGRDGKTRGEFSAIFFNTQKFEILKQGTFWLSETPGKVSKGWDAAFPRICSYAEFKDLETGKKFWVFNTHFDHIGVKAREKSARLISDKIKELNKEELPFILMGDFNLEPESSEIQFLSEKFDDSKSVANLVYGPSGTFNGYHFMQQVTRRIDYIFTSKGDFDILKYAVLSDSKDLKYPSDHLPVLVSLIIK